MSGATKDYRFGQKNHWRRTVWNEVLRRTNGREKTSPILYLAGPNDIDRGIAVGKGVPPQNLIAIDRCEANAAKVRSSGSPSIYGDALTVLWTWPKRVPVAAVMLDLCSGLTRDSRGMYIVSGREPFRDAVFMMNHLRGRDQIGAAAVSFLSKEFEILPGEVATARLFDVDPKHRGAANINLNVAIFAEELLAICRSRGYSETESCERAGRVVDRLLERLNPRFYSYKSGSLVFDSVVFESYTKDAFDSSDGVMKSYEEEFQSGELKRRIAAMLAVRTSRIRSA